MKAQDLLGSGNMSQAWARLDSPYPAAYLLVL
jgi:hypothetical protein